MVIDRLLQSGVRGVQQAALQAHTGPLFVLPDPCMIDKASVYRSFHVIHDP